VVNIMPLLHYPQEKLWYPLKEGKWATGVVWTGFGKDKNPLPPPGMEPQTSSLY
jgi:hypothetical protein